MLSCLLSCVSHDMISIYPVYIILCLYPVSYHIISLSYHDHQADPNISLLYKIYLRDHLGHLDLIWSIGFS